MQSSTDSLRRTCPSKSLHPCILAQPDVGAGVHEKEDLDKAKHPNSPSWRSLPGSSSSSRSRSERHVQCCVKLCERMHRPSPIQTLSQLNPLLGIFMMPFREHNHASAEGSYPSKLTSVSFVRLLRLTIIHPLQGSALLWGWDFRNHRTQRHFIMLEAPSRSRSSFAHHHRVYAGLWIRSVQKNTSSYSTSSSEMVLQS
jgi:hypothetical protein